MADPPRCECHGELMLWQKDSRTKNGGYWVCRAKRREHNLKRHQQRVDWMRDKFNTDAVYRQQTLMRSAAAKRGKRRMARNKQTPPNPRMAVFLQALRPKGGKDGALQTEGRDRPPLEQDPPPDHP